MLHSLLKLPDIYWSDDGSRPAVLPGDAELPAVALASLRGQFSLAGSQADDRVVCVRDRLGINKLFFAVHESGRVIVANYLIDLVDHGIPFEAIYSVPAGHVVELDVVRRRLSLRPYARLDDGPLEGAPLRVLAREIRSGLELWFSRLSEELRSRPVCVCLSGGLDSSLIAALAARYLTNVTAYTYGYVDTGPPESEDASYALRVAEYLGLPCRFVPASRRDILDALEAAICFGQDWRDFNVHCAIVNEIIARVVADDARQHARSGRQVALTGDLMNELLADYTPVSLNGQQYYRLPRLRPGALRAVLVRGLDAGDREVGVFHRHGVDVLQPYGLVAEKLMGLPEPVIAGEQAKRELFREVAGDLIPPFVFDRRKVRAQVGSSERPIGVLPVLAEQGCDAAWLKRAFCRIFRVPREGFLTDFIRAGRYRFLTAFPQEGRVTDGYFSD